MIKETYQTFSLNPHDVKWAPFGQIRKDMTQLFRDFTGNGALVLNGEGLKRQVYAILNRVKAMGYYYQLFLTKDAESKCCRLIHRSHDYYFKANGETAEEAVLRACALVILYQFQENED